MSNKENWKGQVVSDMRLCKTAPRCESQKHATFTPHIESFLKEFFSSCFVPKYLGLTVLPFFFFMFVCVLSSASIFFLFTVTLSHSYTYNKLKFTLKPFYKNVDTENIFFFWNFSWSSSEHEQKAKLVFFEAEYDQKYLRSFKFFGCFIYSQKTKTNPGFVLATGIQGLSSFHVNMLKIGQTWNSSDGKTSST